MRWPSAFRQYAFWFIYIARLGVDWEQRGVIPGLLSIMWVFFCLIFILYHMLFYLKKLNHLLVFLGLTIFMWVISKLVIIIAMHSCFHKSYNYITIFIHLYSFFTKTMIRMANTTIAAEEAYVDTSKARHIIQK